MSFQNVKQDTKKLLRGIQGVVGVGGSPAEGRLRVYVEGSPGREVIPESVSGYGVDIIEVGHIRALPLIDTMDSLDASPVLQAVRTTQIRPVPGGVSVSSIRTTAGTLGSAVIFNDKIYGLSNNHVLADCDSYQSRRAIRGDICLQPGAYDGGRVGTTDELGTLQIWRPFNLGAENSVDVALLEPYNQPDLTYDILDVGPLMGYKEPQVSMTVGKSGRTSGYNTEAITDIDATIIVDLGGGLSVTKNHQIMTGFMGLPGDSGSLLCDTVDSVAVGLLNSGSEFVTIHDHITNVVSELSLPLETVFVPTAYSIIPPFLVGLATLFLL